MIAVFTVLLVLTLSMVIVRIATVALTLTGLSDPLARFQARSAFFGVGFTTKESEDVVNHPVRRRIIMLLMLLGQVGIITSAATLIGSFARIDDQAAGLNSYWPRLGVLITGVVILWWISHSRHIDRAMSLLITWALKRWTTIEVRDYSALLRLSHNYSVSELQVEPEDWLAGQTLAQLQLAKEGVLVLGIERASGRYIGAPRGSTRLSSGDTLILYGREETLVDLDQRQAGLQGNMHHVIAVTQEHEIEEQQETGESDAADPPT